MRGKVRLGRRTFALALLLATLTLVSSAAAAITSEFDFGSLIVTSDADDPITIACAGGGVTINGFNPDTGPAACSEVSSMAVAGGPGANTINVAGVVPGSFPDLTSIGIFADEGADSLTGSPLEDQVGGGPGNDVLRGAEGSDTIDGGEGNDTLTGGLGDDILTVDAGSDSLDGQGGSDEYEVAFAEELGTVRISDTGNSGTDVVTITDCEGVVLTPATAKRGDQVVHFAGIETYPCEFNPPPGSKPQPGDKLKPAACAVPKVTGKTLKAAKTAITKGGCSVGKVGKAYSAKVKKGRIASQKPKASTKLAGGGKVTVVVSRGAKPKRR